MRRSSIALIVALVFCACSGKSNSGPAPTSTPTPSSAGNILQFNIGSNSGGLVNSPMATVTICQSGTNNCQSIPNIVVDTGSFGLRIASSVLTTALTGQTDPSGNPVAECAVFGSFTAWGPVELGTIKMASEPGVEAPIQVIGDPNFAPAPGQCTSGGPPLASTPAELHSNGILGIGLFHYDCGNSCTTSGPTNPGFYYSCSSTSASSCSVIGLPLPNQVQNPVALLPVDNNGVIIQLPQISPNGAASVNGTVTFGIGTESNNGAGGQTAYTADNVGNFSVTYNNTNYPGSFIDSGSNGLFFPDSSIPACGSGASGFYCPPATLSLSATTTGINGAASTVSFQVANAKTLFSATNFAFNDLAGPYNSGFDLGLPFFFGRLVFVGLNGASTPFGTGPFWAY